MRHTKKYKIQTAVRVTVLWLFALICLAPFYVAVCYAFKSKTEFAKTKLAFPTTLYLQNFVDAFELKNYFNSVKNSAIVAICVVILIVIICSMSAYIITRKNNKFYNFIFYSDGYFNPFSDHYVSSLQRTVFPACTQHPLGTCFYGARRIYGILYFPVCRFYQECPHRVGGSSKN